MTDNVLILRHGYCNMEESVSSSSRVRFCQCMMDSNPAIVRSSEVIE